MSQDSTSQDSTRLVRPTLDAEIALRTRRSLLTGAVTLAAAAIGLRLWNRGPKIGGMYRPLRSAFNFNSAVSGKILGKTALAPTYPATSAVKRPFPNGPLGLRMDLDPASWRLQLTGLHQPQNHPAFVADVASWQYRYQPSFTQQASKADSAFDDQPLDLTGNMTEDNVKLSTIGPGPAKNGQNANPQPPPPRPSGPGLLLTMTDLKCLPFVEQTTEFKCVEGWSQIVTYGGVRFRDFFEAYLPLCNADGSLPRYAALATPDGTYYSGFELADLLHPQTLLCYQMSRQDLTPAHGAPLRLAMPLKYGYKQIKQIASITYSNTKPADYWGSHSYDWDGGL
ncbi:molybdopterin-dependent oxidoreductase [Acidicapsa acidisoli]|uniref:molybdopterin-dependent oxidoreductase n=1 Tax=Acidicapsa acidisoli TaxID=1615681 RepID=UPI0021E056A6|nr:molybdopterin-dependent oxidoreductase [Acidicapsa acidisoli]